MCFNFCFTDIFLKNLLKMFSTLIFWATSAIYKVLLPFDEPESLNCLHINYNNLTLNKIDIDWSKDVTLKIDLKINVAHVTLRRLF